MNYIAVDLKVIEVKAPGVARAMGLDVAAVIGSLALLWHRCWSAKSDKVGRLELRGYFQHPEAGELLAAFGLLESDGSDWRVKGADRYLRIAEQRQKAGATRARSAGRSAGRFTSGAPAEHQRSTSGAPALSPSTEHRTPNTKEEVPLPPVIERAPAVFVEPTTPPDTWTGEDFFAWAQALRQKAGLIGERRRPRDLNSWWSTALMTPGVTVERLQQAFIAFGDSKHWQTRTPPLPFGGFVSQWDQFLGREVRHAS